MSEREPCAQFVSDTTRFRELRWIKMEDSSMLVSIDRTKLRIRIVYLVLGEIAQQERGGLIEVNTKLTNWKNCIQHDEEDEKMK